MLNEDLHKEGFRLMGEGLIDINRRPFEGIDITNVYRMSTIKNDSQIATLRLVAIP
jgi:hypothetical protein